MYGASLDTRVYTPGDGGDRAGLTAFFQSEGFKLYAYVILENHLHMVVQSENLSRDMARFKSYTSRRLLDYLVQRNVWQILDQLAFYKKAHKRDRAY